ncbi:MAG: hypothetical protein MUC64_17280, partial [Rubritepida sp.]|nr:hypothetical protein [Rubritepida sp.]
MREEGRRDPDHRREAQRDDEAGQDAGHEHLADRDLGQHAIDDHEQGWRDQHAKDAAARHRAGREAHRVAVPHHLRHRDLREHRGRGDRDAGDGGEHRVGADRCHAEPAAHAGQQRLRDVEGVLPHVRDADQQPHQHEERDGGEEVILDPRIGCERGEAESEVRVVADQPDADGAGADQRDADRQ